MGTKFSDLVDRYRDVHMRLPKGRSLIRITWETE